VSKAVRPRNSLKDVPKTQMMPDQGQKWLRQQLKYFYAEYFEALVKRWTSESMLVEDMSGNKCFLKVRISHVLRFISICDLFTDCPSYYTETCAQTTRGDCFPENHRGLQDQGLLRNCGLEEPRRRHHSSNSIKWPVFIIK
jgi:hypothetical protein